jgi:autotransporter-associated beta strand protein
MKTKPNSFLTLSSFPAFLALCLMVASPARGATLYWDGGIADIAGNGDSASAGGDGTWNTTLQNWDQGAVPHVAWTNGNDAVLAGSGGYVTLGTSISASSISLSSNNYTIATDSGSLTLTGGATTGGKYHQIAGVGGLVLSGTQTLDISGGMRVSAVVSGSGILTKTGSGMLSFSNGNGFTGKFIINQGRFGINGDAALGAVPGSPVADSITIDGGILGNGIVSNASGNFDNGGVFTLNVNRGITMGIAGGTIQVGYGIDGRMSIAGVITGDGSLTKIDGGDLALYGANTYSSGTIVSEGALSVGELAGNSANEGSNSGLGTGDVSIESGGQLILAGNNLTIANDITLNGAPTVNNRQGALVGGYQDGDSSNTLTGTLTLAGFGNHSLSTWWSDKSLTLAGQVTGTGTLQVLNIRPDNSNAGGVIILNNATNDYSGGTTINSGNYPTLRLGASNVIPDGPGKGDVTADGWLDLNGFTDTINGLSGSGFVTLGNGGILFAGNTDATGYNFSGGLIGTSTARLRKIGTGTLTLSGTGDNIDARARVEAGTLLLAKDNSATAHALGSGGGTDNALEITGGTARLGGTGGDQIYQNSAVNLAGGTFDLAGLNEGFDGLSGSGGTITNSIVSTTSTLTLGQNNSNGSPVYSGNIGNGAGTVALQKTGSGSQTLAGTHTYTGDTTVAAGTLAVTGTLGLTAVTVESGGTLGGNGNIGGNVTIESGGRHALAVANAPGNQITRTISGVLTLDGGDIIDLTSAGVPALGTYVVATANGGIVGNLLNSTIHYNGFAGNLVIDGKNLKLTVTGASGYSTWAGINAGGQDPDQDFDSDGVSNGVEYFLGETGSTFTANPGLDSSNTVTWTNGGNIAPSAYGTQFVVQTSTNLANWTNVPIGNVTNNEGSVSYTVIGTGKQFVRLKLTPN